MGKINFFKPEDFKPLTGDTSISLSHASVIANEKLQKLIEESPTVYGSMIMKDSVVGVPFGEVSSQEDTHKAKLMFIEELPNEPCKHESLKLICHSRAICNHCGVNLKHTWSEV